MKALGYEKREQILFWIRIVLRIVQFIVNKLFMPNDAHERRPGRAGEKNGCQMSCSVVPARSGSLCAALAPCITKTK